MTVSTVSCKLTHFRCAGDRASSDVTGRRVLRDMPQHAGRIEHIGHAQAPGLHCGRTRRRHAERRRQIGGFDLAPLGVQIAHQQMHREIFRKRLLVIGLQQESERPDADARHRVIQRMHLEPQGGVERLAAAEIERRHERPQGDYESGLQTFLFIIYEVKSACAWIIIQ